MKVINDEEERILKIIKKAYPNMSDFDKGYVLGLAEKTSNEWEKKKTTVEPEVMG